MKKTFLLVFMLSMVAQIAAQEKYLSKDGYVSFFSHSLVEDIKANNNQVLSIINTETGEIAIQLLMRSFIFKKALMQEHFNESYVESHKYPKAKFNGKIMNFSELNREDDETEIKGVLSIHGKDIDVTIVSKVNFSKGMIVLSGDFQVEVANFDIKIPAVVRNNIARVIKVTFNIKHKPYD